MKIFDREEKFFQSSQFCDSKVAAVNEKHLFQNMIRMYQSFCVSSNESQSGIDENGTGH